ncbi:MAG: sensor histidine kinase [Clostridia bacterium]|nr:sensor histidine kinase [Clostridia bacterium]MBR4451892.1 sensor histidine kinase [Clostridia bacterium]
MKYMSITKRWFLTVASLVFVILVAVAFLVYGLILNYYYGAARMTVEAMNAGEINSIFSLYGASTAGFEDAARNYVENFQSKDKLAVWIINRKGKVIVSSNGFSISDDVNMPDYTDALNSPEGTARWIGRLPSGEKIMSYTCTYHYNNGDYGGAIRYMVSMDAIDAQMRIVAVLITSVFVIVFGFLIISSTLFLRSIVGPVKSIGEAAKKIAAGDFETNIDHYPYNDEIGELCNTINDMTDKLGETEKLKNDFISTVSHELRTPLTAIRGWGETIQQMGDSDPEMRERGMEIIISESARLNNMVEELLDFSRLSSGRMRLNTARIDFLSELDEVVFSFKDRSEREGIEIAYNTPGLSAPGLGDASRVRQVFINVLDNAMKYTEQGGRVSVSADLPDPGCLIITVTDTGCGISPEDLPHIKEKFYKANNTVRGSGIGLAVCDEIMNLHGGKLEIDSVQGQGTSVRLTFPLEGREKDNE